MAQHSRRCELCFLFESSKSDGALTAPPKLSVPPPSNAHQELGYHCPIVSRVMDSIGPYWRRKVAGKGNLEER